MFTGLVEGTARLQRIESDDAGARLWLELATLAEGVDSGASVAVAGACLTVVTLEASLARFDLSLETLAKTHFSSAAIGDVFNIERSLRVGDALGGHLVTGHVDGVGRVLAVESQGEFATHTYQAPAEVAPLLVDKGSVVVEGVSLTVVDPTPSGRFQVALIPETLQRTTLGRLSVGATLHMEGDLIGKYVYRYLRQRETSD